MKKTILVALSIVLMLFAFASCSNDSGKQGFTGDASEIAEALDPAKLVGDVLKADAENVDVEYKLIQGGASSSAAKAVAGSATLQATVTFDGYKVPNTSYVITDGTLVYVFEGTVSAEGKFIANSTATVKTGSKLIVDTDKGNAEVAISEVKASVNAFTADVSKAGSDGVLPADTAITVNVTVDEDIKVSVGDKDVTVKPEEPAPEPEPTIKTIGTEAELREAAENGSGEYTLTADIRGLTSQVSIKAPITINGAGHTISAITPITGADKATASIILIEVDNVVLKDLSVNGTRVYTPRQDWHEGEFGIKVWNAKGVVLEDVKVSKVNAGIQINSAEVTIKGTENELSNNNWGGIGVTTDTSGTLDPGNLVIAAGAKIACTDEQSPVVWTESKGTVDDRSGLISFEVTSNDESQTWYITEDQVGETVDQRYIHDEDEFKDAIQKTGTYYIDKKIEVSGYADITASGITLIGVGNDAELFFVDGATVGENQSAFTIHGGNVEINGIKVSYDSFKQATEDKYAFILTAYGDGLKLEGVEFALEGESTPAIAGPNFYGAKNVELTDVTVSGTSAKAPLNMSNASVTINSVTLGRGTFGTSHGADLDYDIQVNDQDGASSITIANPEGIEAIWVEDDSSVSISDHEITEFSYPTDSEKLMAFLENASNTDFAEISYEGEGSLYATKRYIARALTALTQQQ